MKDMEDKVRAMKVVEPSPELDRRIARLLSKTGQSARRMPFARRNIPLWACAAACVVALCTGLLVGRSTLPSDPQAIEPLPLIYVIDSGDHVAGNAFDWTFQEDRFLEATSGSDIHVTISQAPNSG